MHGTMIDLALSTLDQDVRVVVISTDRILSTTLDEKLPQAAEWVHVPDECDKTKVVCAVLHNEHFDLGVLRTGDSIQAVFQEGQEWNHALQLLLSFIKSRSPPAHVPKREPLGPQWVPPASQSHINPGGERG